MGLFLNQELSNDESLIAASKVSSSSKTKMNNCNSKTTLLRKKKLLVEKLHSPCNFLKKVLVKGKEDNSR